MHPTQFRLIPALEPSQIPVLQRTAGFGVETQGLNMRFQSQHLRHSWMWICHEKSNLYRKLAVDKGQIRLFTWLATLCCGLTWKCTDTQRGIRAQTLRGRHFCKYRPGTLIYKCSYSWNSPFYSSGTLKWNWMTVLIVLVMLSAFILKIMHGHRQAFSHIKLLQGFCCDTALEIW